MHEMTLEEFNVIEAGSVFAKGETTNSPEGVYMTNSNLGASLRWVAKKGYGNDWCIYIYWNYTSWEFVETNGDKVTNSANIQKLVPCTPEVESKYRF